MVMVIASYLYVQTDIIWSLVSARKLMRGLFEVPTEWSAHSRYTVGNAQCYASGAFDS